MKVWTYGEAVQKIKDDLDLNDETFIKEAEMAGYFNEALTQSEANMINLNQDYFLTKYYVPQLVGVSAYLLPANIFANRIRSLMFSSGAIIYEVNQLRRMGKFENIALINQYGVSDDYQYILQNDRPGQATMILYPTSREAAVLSPVANLFAPLTLWYLRNCARVPVVGEYCNPEIILPTQVNTGTGEIQTFAGTSSLGTFQQGLPGGYPGSIAYKTGDAVKFQAGPNGSVPGGITAGTTYYVIAGVNGLIKLATSRANAFAGTAITLTTTGTVYCVLQVAATTAIQNATLIDIPEFVTFTIQWVKCRCMEKEGDPRLDGALKSLEKLETTLNETLNKGVDDDDDKIQMDMSFYNELS